MKAGDIPIEPAGGDPACWAHLFESDDRGALPEGLSLVRTTPLFDQDSVPAGLRRAHKVADDVWGRLVVSAGSLVFVFEDQPGAPLAVAAGEHVIIPPGRPHHLEFDGEASFVVEFHQAVAEPDA